DLLETRRWIDEEEYRLALALAQIMPGPLAAQLAIALGYFQRGVLGATAIGLAFVVPSFLMVVAISIAYRRYGGLWWMQALFFGMIMLTSSCFVNLTRGSEHVLHPIIHFFMMADAVVFASVLAIVSFLQQDVVQQFGWLNEHQFLHAVAVAMITPRPVVITLVI